MKVIISILLAFLLSGIAQAEPSHLRERQTGKYLGNLSANPYGRYGSDSQDSINNPYGQYGTPYSNDSANNPYATNPPRFTAMTGKITKNPLHACRRYPTYQPAYRLFIFRCR